MVEPEEEAKAGVVEIRVGFRSGVCQKKLRAGAPA